MLSPQQIEARDCDDPAPRKSPFRTRRAWQLAILEQMTLRKDYRSRDNRPVKPVQLASVLRAIDNRAREAGWYMLPIEDATDKATGRVIQRGLATESHLSVRQCKRCLEVAQGMGWLEKHVQPMRSGADRCWWRIVFVELARTTTLPLWWETPGPECPPATNHVPDSEGPSAQLIGTKCPTDWDQVPNWPVPRAHAGTQETSKTTKSAQKAPSDVSADGARCFSEMAIQSIQAKAQRIDKWARAKKPDDRELVLKVATLWHDRRLSDDQLEQMLESFRRKADAGDPVENPAAWVWRTLENKCEEAGDNFCRLLATTDFPRVLLIPPAQRNRQVLANVTAGEHDHAESRRQRHVTVCIDRSD